VALTLQNPFFQTSVAGALADGREELMRGLSARMRTRGPDGSGYYGNERFGLAHERLAIMDPEGGKQPIVYEDEKL
jgi:asparagine synthase (glutamine-hydrolysing)